MRENVTIFLTIWMLFVDKEDVFISLTKFNQFLFYSLGSQKIFMSSDIRNIIDTLFCVILINIVCLILMCCLVSKSVKA